MACMLYQYDILPVDRYENQLYCLVNMLELFPYSEPEFFENKFDETFTPKTLQVVLQGPNN